MNTRTIDGQLFANMLKGGAATLSANRQIVNDLNVFPIPDGDTGDNMSMTIDSGVAALNSESKDSLSEAASLAAKGMLLGARGNSGVILSRIFSGISRGLDGVQTADAAVLSRALESGVDEAYSAVSNPVEGTILTVYRDAVKYAGSELNDESTVEGYLDNFLKELRRSLDRTPKLLDVLKKAGVVDSGGAGFIYIVEGMKMALGGEDFSYESVNDLSAKRIDFSAFDENSVLEYGYCTEFLLRLQNKKVSPENFDIEAFKDFLNSVGDSVVAFREGTIVKAHVHTKKPGDVLNYCQQYGEFLTTKIENMSLQHNELHTEEHFEPQSTKPRKKYGIVSVASGSGIKEMFISLGCDVVVDGGQCMNPSAEDLISAFRQINADRIFIYPNNSNIILTAEQAASLYDEAEVTIIPSRTIGEGYAAISMLDTECDDVDRILSEQKEMISGVITGIVSQAVRDTDQDGVSIHKDEYIGFVGDKILNCSADKNQALAELASRLDAASYDIVMVVCGESVSTDESDEIYSRLTEACSPAEVIIIDGRQPVYDYILILE